MEVEEIQTPQQPATKYSRVNTNGSRGVLGDQAPSGSNLEHNARRGGGGTASIMTAASALNGVEGSNTRFGRQWQHSSRIIRVSRASGGKDRHSKVWTAKGPRDRRVRLSVSTAIQFYDLQDRLGYDQPSKAVEWLIGAAADAINELPSLNSSSFPPETPRQLSDERRSGNVVDSGDAEQFEPDPTTFGQDNLSGGGGGLNQMGSKSGCSSNNSETSKGSGLSLSRSEIRVKARERARERTAKEKERDSEPVSRVDNVVHTYQQQPNVSSISQQASSFTQLLTAGINNLNENATAAKTSGSHSPHHGNERGTNNNSSSNLQWLSNCTTTPMADYFGTGFMGLSASSSRNASLPQIMTLSPFNLGGSENHHSHHQQHHHQQQHEIHQHFPFLSDQHHLLQVPNHNTTTNNHNHATGAGTGSSGGSEYNLNFSISSSSTTSGLAAGFNRGTLQSNSNTSPSLLSYLQRFSAADGSSVPFFLGGASISPSVNNNNDHNQFNSTGLHLCYGDGGRHSVHKGKEKN